MTQETAIKFITECMKYPEPKTFPGSSRIYYRGGRFNPDDLNEVKDALQIWSRENAMPFSIIFNHESTNSWEVSIWEVDIITASPDLIEAIFNACIEAQKHINGVKAA